ncbi:hypothetical protein [Jiangella endophytica]|nr:hypothetical protein [Jiangella endophytica]
MEWARYRHRRRLQEADAELARAVVDVGPRLTSILAALLDGYGRDATTA